VVEIFSLSNVFFGVASVLHHVVAPQNHREQVGVPGDPRGSLRCPGADLSASCRVEKTSRSSGTTYAKPGRAHKPRLARSLERMTWVELQSGGCSLWCLFRTFTSSIPYPPLRRRSSFAVDENQIWQSDRRPVRKCRAATMKRVAFMVTCVVALSQENRIEW
jgi:hypothetical protein